MVLSGRSGRLRDIELQEPTSILKKNTTRNGSPGWCSDQEISSDQLDGDLLPPFGRRHILRHLVEVEIFIDLGRHGIELADVSHVLLDRRQLTQDRRHRGQLRRGEEDVGPLTQTVGKVTGRGGDRR